MHPYSTGLGIQVHNVPYTVSTGLGIQVHNVPYTVNTGRVCIPIVLVWVYRYTMFLTL